ncbi:shikimate dehydrogenase [Microbacterium sp. NPDC076911]|uniref:shikimate dehydrogenase n=1 Tax=Microbacterium sp. NPDC076911 TaxID=3154958 RepID=UPI003430FAB5
MLTSAELAVWGDPIEHSRSPRLHAAAYRALGLNWHYGRRCVNEQGFAAALASLDERWRGLSLTMPLKTAAFNHAISHDRHSALTGVANTLLLTVAGPRAFNTDVGGLVRALGEDGVAQAPTGRIIGAGATATSALIALSEIGARDVQVVARRPESVLPLRALGEKLGVQVDGVAFGAERFNAVTVTIATLPGGTVLDDAQSDALADSGGHLCDVVYGNWPTPLSTAWVRAGHTASSGLGMLLHQAVLQVRVFTSGEIDVPLNNESAVVAEMRATLMGD